MKSPGRRAMSKEQRKTWLVKPSQRGGRPVARDDLRRAFELARHPETAPIAPEKLIKS